MSINKDLLTAAGGLTAGHPVIVVDGIAFPVGVQGAGGGGGDLPSVSFTAKDLKVGKTAINTLGAVVSGTMPETQITVLGAVVSATSGYVSSGAIATIPDATYSMSVKDSERKVEVSVTSGGYMATGETSSLSLPSPTFSSTTGTTVSASSATVKKTVSSGGYLKKGDTVSVDIARGSATLSGNVFKVSSGYHISSSINMPGAEVVVDGAKVNVTSAGYAWVGTWATIPSAVVNVSGAQVTVTSGGYVSSGAIATIPSAEITSTTTAIRIGAGYVSSAVEFPISYSGDAQYGVVDDNGKFQPLDMTVSPPVNSGTALEATYRTIATGLPYPDGEEVTPGGGGDGISQLVKVSEFIAPHDAFTATESIEVSGFGEDGTEDYSAWNGTYHVTPATASETSTEKRVYKHATKNKYLYRMCDNDSGDYYWVFNTSTSADYVYDAEFYADELESGTWNNYEYEVSVSLTIAQNSVNYPKQELVLKVQPATGSSISNDLRTWEFGDAMDITKYETTPVEGAMHVLLGGDLLSNKVYPTTAQGVNGLLFYAPLTSADNDLVTGSYTASKPFEYSEYGAELESLYLLTDVPVSALQGDFTFFAEVTVHDTSHEHPIFAAYDSNHMIGLDTTGNAYSMYASSTEGDWNILTGNNDYTSDEDDVSGRGSIATTRDVTQRVAMTRNGDIWELYVDNVLSLRRNRPGTIRATGYIALHRWGSGVVSMTNAPTAMKNVKIYSRGMTAEEIAQL